MKKKILAGLAMGLLVFGSVGIARASDLFGVVTELVSINLAGTDSGNGGSGLSGLSADGRFVGFASLASDLVANDTNGVTDVFVRDLRRRTTTLVGVNQEGTASGNRGSRGDLALNANGRFVAFTSESSDLVANDHNGQEDVFVRDLQTGTTTLVSVNREGTDSGNGFSQNPVLSADGRFVAFASDASDLVATDTNGATDVFVRPMR